MFFGKILPKLKGVNEIYSNGKPTLRKYFTFHRYFSTSVYLVDEQQEKAKSKHKTSDYTSRTVTCGELGLQNVGLQVTLCGWLEFRRLDKFILLRDGYGQTQLLIKDKDQNIKDAIKQLSLESILKIKGTVLARPKEMINPKQPTGAVEVVIEDLEILNEAADLPFNIRGFQRPKEAVRMKYRYLDLRFPQMQRNLRLRSDLLFKMRQFLMDSNFVDVETPTLFKFTPGGAQEFIVPTKFPGQFYSLVQSPQQFKQILMAGGIDRYFQVARCYRDETSRPDRQPEFTQLDIEMSFTTVNGVILLIEDLLNFCWPDFAGTIPRRFERIKYADAMEWYGNDKPDTSFDFKLKNCTSILQSTGLNLYKDDFGAYYLQFPKEYAKLTKSVKDKFEILAKQFPTVKFIQHKISMLDWITKMKKLFTEEVAHNLKDEIGLEDESILFLAYGERTQVVGLLGRIRLLYIDHLESTGLSIRKTGMHLAWIMDFPLFDKGDQPNFLSAAHHPFTAPNPEDMHLLHEAPLKVRALAYDLVLNGNEIAGGSIRIHDPSLQEAIFKLLNIDTIVMKHITEMLSSGCPPHGGIAVGVDRLMSILLNTQSIRDVIAFPKGAEGRDPLSGAPCNISEQILKMYHIKCL